MVESGLQVQDVSRALTLEKRTLPILRNISFEVRQGEWVALTGPSGSGKSTLLGILGGIDRPTAGRVLLDGIELNALSEQKLARVRNEKIGVVFQGFYLLPTMSAQENVQAPLYIHRERKRAAALATAMLERVGLGDRVKHLPHQLSGGEQQRVAIARALVTQPRVLLADEPTGNLDSANGKRVLDLLRDLRAQLGLTIVMVTHDEHVAGYAERRLHLVDGQFQTPPQRGEYA
ncbi:MAG: ABC transporter ATP-binding protein [Anaerolineae bacterium]|nr:ABC transporter ATP-binding protein [Anaerolineae bacterium]